jgi:hypothetical protein
MAGYQAIESLRRLEERVDRLGMRMGHPRHGNYRLDFGDLVALSPKDDTLPVYSRDAELFTGTLAQMEHWLNGWEKMQQYHHMLLGNKYESKIQRLEQDYRNEFLMKNIKQAGQQSVEITDA